MAKYYFLIFHRTHTLGVSNQQKANLSLSIIPKSLAILSLPLRKNFQFLSLLRTRKILSLNLHYKFSLFLLRVFAKNFPTGPFPFISLSFSKVKYAKPGAPCSFAHLSISSKTSGFIFSAFSNYCSNN